MEHIYTISMNIKVIKDFFTTYMDEVKSLKKVIHTKHHKECTKASHPKNVP